MCALKYLTATLCSVLIALSAMAMSAAAESNSTPRPKAGASKKAQAKTADKDDGVDERDYYTRRAQEMLDEDKKAADSKPHPLAVNYPEHYVTVCTGGCKNFQAQIVDFEPRKKSNTTEIGEMIPTAAGGTNGAMSNVVRCVGGCPEGNTIHVLGGGMADDWDSTGSNAMSGTTSESGRWLSDQN